MAKVINKYKKPEALTDAAKPEDKATQKDEKPEKPAQKASVA